MRAQAASRLALAPCERLRLRLRLRLGLRRFRLGFGRRGALPMAFSLSPGGDSIFGSGLGGGRRRFVRALGRLARSGGWQRRRNRRRGGGGRGFAGGILRAVAADFGLGFVEAGAGRESNGLMAAWNMRRSSVRRKRISAPGRRWATVENPRLAAAGRRPAAGGRQILHRGWRIRGRSSRRGAMKRSRISPLLASITRR